MTARASEGDGEPMHIALLGPEPLRRRLTVSGEGELRVNCGEEDAACSVRNAGLFSRSIRVSGCEVLTEREAGELVEAIATSALPVIVVGDKFPTKALAQLEKVARVRKLALRSNGVKLLHDIAHQCGVTLSGECASYLIARLAHDPGRLVGIIEVLGRAGISEPSVAQLRVMAGSSREDGLPWILLEEIARGDSKARETILRSEAIPTIAFLAKRITIAAISIEQAEPNTSEARELVGDISDSAWTQSSKLGRKLGRDSCYSLLRTMARADRLAKRGEPQAALALVCGSIRLHLLRAT
jgi:hypothetical protein